MFDPYSKHHTAPAKRVRCELRLSGGRAQKCRITSHGYCESTAGMEWLWTEL